MRKWIIIIAGISLFWVIGNINSPSILEPEESIPRDEGTDTAHKVYSSPRLERVETEAKGQQSRISALLSTSVDELIHLNGRKYPWRIREVKKDREAVHAATHLLVSTGDDLTSATNKRLLEANGFGVRSLTDRAYLVSWTLEPETPFADHRKVLKSLLPEDALVEKNYLIEAMGWIDGEAVYDPEDKLGHQWLYENNLRADGIVVAVLDTGVRLDHPDLKGVFYENPGEKNNGRDSDGNGYIDDVTGWDFVDDDNEPNDESGHGTAIAGIIAGNPENGEGVAGFAPGVRILPVRILDEFGEGWDSQILEGVEYARKSGADLINASWGRSGGDYPDTLEAEISNYIRDGGLFIASAGNNGKNIDFSPIYPASLPNDLMVTVAGLDDSGTDIHEGIRGDSNYGFESVDTAAPWKIPTISLESTDLEESRGTSMSTAVISGLAATVKAANPELSLANLRDRILKTGNYRRYLQGSIAHAGHPDLRRMLSNTREPLSIIESHEVLAAEHYEGDRSRIFGGEDYSLNLKMTYGDTDHVTTTDNGGDHIPYEQILIRNTTRRYTLFSHSASGSVEYGSVLIRIDSSEPFFPEPLPDTLNTAEMEEPLVLSRFMMRGNRPINFSIELVGRGVIPASTHYSYELTISPGTSRNHEYIVRANTYEHRFEIGYWVSEPLSDELKDFLPEAASINEFDVFRDPVYGQFHHEASRPFQYFSQFGWLRFESIQEKNQLIYDMQNEWLWKPRASESHVFRFQDRKWIRYF